jgi:hypothetical protein
LTQTQKTAPLSAEEWPYNFEEAETRLNLDVIRKQGHYFLKRALNIERMVAFVGVGASMAYGRVTWGELALVQIDVIDRFFSPDKLLRLGNKLDRAVKLLQHIRKDVELNNSDAIILSMQIAEQIWTLCPPDIRDELAKQFRITNHNTTLQERESGPSYFRTVIKSETLSVRPHIISILSNRYKHSSSDKFDCYAKSLLSNNLVPKRANILPPNSIDDVTEKIANVFSNRMIQAASNSASILRSVLKPPAKSKSARKLEIINDFLSDITSELHHFTSGQNERSASTL